MTALRTAFRHFNEVLDKQFDGRGKEFVAVCLVTFLEGCAWFIVVSLFPLYARHLGADEALVGIFGMLPSLVAIISSVPAGALASSMGKPTVFRWSFIVCAVASGAYALAFSHWFLPIPQILFGIAHALFWPAQAASMTDVIPERLRSRMLGFVMSITTAGAIVGPASGGLLAQYAGYRAAYVACGLISVAGILAYGLFPKGQVEPRATAVRRAVAGSMASGRSVLAHDIIRLTTATSIVTFMFWSMMDTFFPLYLQDLHYPLAVIGGITAVRMTFMTVARVVSGGLLARVRTIHAMLVSIIAATGFALVIPSVAKWGPSFLLIACTAVIGAGSGVIPVFTTLLIAEATSADERPVGMAIDSMAAAMGRMTASFTLGIVARAAGLAACLGGGSLVMTAGALGIAIWWGVAGKRGGLSVRAPEAR